MSTIGSPKTDPDHPMFYEVGIRGHLDAQWVNAFGDFVITLKDNGDTLLTGAVVDQAALYGLLKKLRDLGIPLISINRIEPPLTDLTDRTV